MVEKVDARGLSCPQPVFMVLSKLRTMRAGELEVLVDNEVSKENVSRAALSEGWAIAQVQEADDEYRIMLRRS